MPAVMNGKMSGNGKILSLLINILLIALKLLVQSANFSICIIIQAYSFLGI
jgi:hypothetical protein